jgi:hypothetical protein
VTALTQHSWQQQQKMLIPTAKLGPYFSPIITSDLCKG